MQVDYVGVKVAQHLPGELRSRIVWVGKMVGKQLAPRVLVSSGAFAVQQSEAVSLAFQLTGAQADVGFSTTELSQLLMNEQQSHFVGKPPSFINFKRVFRLCVALWFPN